MGDGLYDVHHAQAVGRARALGISVDSASLRDGPAGEAFHPATVFQEQDDARIRKDATNVIKERVEETIEPFSDLIHDLESLIMSKVGIVKDENGYFEIKEIDTWEKAIEAIHEIYEVTLIDADDGDMALKALAEIRGLAARVVNPGKEKQPCQK